MKIHAVKVELFYADGRTDRHDEANSSFSQSAKANDEEKKLIKRMKLT